MHPYSYTKYNHKETIINKTNNISCNYFYYVKIKIHTSFDIFIFCTILNALNMLERKFKRHLRINNPFKEKMCLKEENYYFTCELSDLVEYFKNKHSTIQLIFPEI